MGGALGTLLRARLSSFGASGSLSFPYGILMANIAGSAVLGVVIGVIEEFEPQRPIAFRALVGTGFCGGLTTFSTLCAGTVALATGHAYLMSALYLSVTLITAVLALTLFYFLARALGSIRGLR